MPAFGGAARAGGAQATIVAAARKASPARDQWHGHTQSPLVAVPESPERKELQTGRDAFREGRFSSTEQFERKLELMKIREADAKAQEEANMRAEARIGSKTLLTKIDFFLRRSASDFFSGNIFCMGERNVCR